jgi:hypothetical protein
VRARRFRVKDSQERAQNCFEDGHGRTIRMLSERIVTQIRECWPQTRIILHADSGFCRDELMSWCEGDENSGKRADYGFGFARNERLRKLIEAQMEQAANLHRETGTAARVFTDFI